MFEVICVREYERDQVVARVESKERAEIIAAKFKPVVTEKSGDSFLYADDVYVKEIALFETDVADWSF